MNDPSLDIPKDWREDYVICEHVAALPANPPTEGTRHSGFRVCCEACYPEFLLAEELDKEERGRLCIGWLPQAHHD